MVVVLEDQERESFPAKAILLLIASAFLVAFTVRLLLDVARQFDRIWYRAKREVGRYLR